MTTIGRPGRRLKTMMAAALTAALVAAGCSDPVPPVAPTPAPATITDTFTGTLFVFGANVHHFNVQQVGSVRVSLTAVAPGAAVGLGVGTPSAATGTCLALSTITAVAGSAVQLAGTATVAGSFCVSVTDIGNLVEPVSYTVVVSHS